MNTVNRLGFGFESTLIDRLVQLKNNNNTKVWVNKNFQQFTGAFIAGITDTLLTVPLEFFAAIENALLLPIRAGSSVIKYASWTAYPFASRLGYSSQLTKFQAKQSGITDIIKTAYKAIALAAGTLSTGTVGCVDLFISTDLNYKVHEWLDKNYDLFDNQFQLTEDKQLAEISKRFSLIGHPVVSKENKDSKKNIASQDNTSKTLKNQIAQLKGDLDSKEKELEQARKTWIEDRQNLENKTAAVKKRLEEREKKVERLVHKKQTYLENIQHLERELVALKANLSQAAQEFEAQKAEFAQTKKADNERLAREDLENQKTITELKKGLIYISGSLQENEVQIKKHLEENSSLNQKLQSKEAQLEQSRNECDELNATLKQKQEEYDKAIREVERELAVLKANSLQATQEFEAQKERFAQAKQAYNERLSQENLENQKTITELKKGLIYTSNSLQENEVQIKKHLEENSSLKQKLQSKETDLEQLQKKYEKKQSECERLKKQLSNSISKENIPATHSTCQGNDTSNVSLNSTKNKPTRRKPTALGVVN